MAGDYKARNVKKAAARDFYNGGPIRPDNTFAIAEAKRLAEPERQEFQNRLNKGQQNPNLVISQDYDSDFLFTGTLVSLIFSRSDNRRKRTLTTQTNRLLGLLSGPVRVVRLKLRKRQSASELCFEARHPESVDFTGPQG